MAQRRRLHIPLYAQMVLGASAFATALILLPLAGGTFAGAMLAAPLTARRTARPVVSGAMLLKLLALLLISVTLSNTWSSAILALALTLLGLANGVISATLSTVLVSASAPELGADVGALRGTAINLGNAVGTALVGAVLIAGLASAALWQARENPEVAALTANIGDLDRPQFVSNQQLGRYLETRPNLSREQREAILTINEAARLDALRVAVLFIAGVTSLGLILCRNLPGSSARVEPAGARK